MLAPPKPPQAPEALIPEARDRQRRRRVLAAAGVSSAAALGLTFYALLGGHGQGGLTDGSPRGGVPLCRSSQLSGSVLLQSAMMSGVGPATLTNTGSSECSLPGGIPTVRIMRRGATLNVHERRELGPPWAQGPVTRLIRPGESAAIPMQWQNWCGRRGTLRLFFDLRFRNGLEVIAPDQSTGQPDCIVASATSTLSVGPPFRNQ